MIGSMVASTTGASDFAAAGRSFSKGGFGNTMAGIGHSIMGGINAASTAAMVIPGVGEGIKGADLALNAGVKGVEMGVDAMKGVDAAKSAETASKTGADLYHGTGANIKPGSVITPKPTGVAGTDAAWATPVGKLADRHAEANSMGLGADKQMSLWSPVYKVSPVDASEMSKTTSAFAKNPAIPHGDMKMGVTEFASKKGFKVDSVSHLVENPELTRPSIPKPSIQAPSVPKVNPNTRVLD